MKYLKIGIFIPVFMTYNAYFEETVISCYIILALMLRFHSKCVHILVPVPRFPDSPGGIVTAKKYLSDEKINLVAAGMCVRER
jgi:hypothetical protein